uniref:Uncharacterized protein n=1 Tax=Knipowitschia caucasica TaxID=637954 RepID=A0AAV2J7Z5_KNICA
MPHWLVYFSMEEQPKERAQDKLYQQHGVERHPIHHTADLKHVQSHIQRQHQETYKKKTGYTKLNCNEERGKKLNSSDIVGMSHPTNGNADNSEKRTPSSSSPVGVNNEEGKRQKCGQDKTKEEGKAACSVVGLGIDTGAKCAQGSVTTVLFGSVKESTHFKDNGRRCSWGAFDIKAAVMYHTKEMEIIFNLQKQDPKRVVVYSGSEDGSD